MQVQPAQSDSIVGIVAEAQGLQLMSPDQVPPCGTFWTVLPGPGGGVIPPLPCPPLDPSLPIYQIADRQFLVDETGGQVAVNTRRLGLQAQVTSSTAAAVVAAQADAVVNLITQVQTAAANQQMRTMARAMSMDVPTPDGGGSDDDTNTFTSNASNFTVDYGTNLWIAQVAIQSGNLVGIMSNSVADTPYEIQSCENLLGSWNSEGAPVYGSETANWTPFSVTMNNRTNLFVRIKSWADSTGSGIPDWWWLQYFGSVGGEGTTFELEASYASGNSAGSTADLAPYYPQIWLVPGAQSSNVLAVSALPSGTAAIRITRVDYYARLLHNDSSFNSSLDIPLSAFTNGLYLLSSSMTASPTDSYG